MTLKYKVFISRPYDKAEDAKNIWNNLYINGIAPAIPLINKDTSNEYELEIYDAEREPSIEDIKDKVPVALNESDIFLCVLSEFRPSVMFEVGYSRKLGLPSIYLLGKSYANKTKPILIGEPDTLYYVEEPTAFNIIPEKLSEYLLQACKVVELKQHQKDCRINEPVYSVACYKDRNAIDIPEKMQKASKKIKILTTNMHYFVSPDFIEDNQENGAKLDYLGEALERGVKITILTMDPDSNLVVERYKQLNPQYSDDVYRYREELRQSIIAFYKKFIDHVQNNNLILNLYDSLPTQMQYWIDDDLYVPSMAGDRRSRECIHVMFNENLPGVPETYTHHFSLVFRESKAIQQFSWIGI